MSIIRELDDHKSKLGELDRRQQRTVYKNTPLTSTSWDGDARSNTLTMAVLDLSAVFTGYPTGVVRAVYVEVGLRDSGSAANDCYLQLGPTDQNADAQTFRCSGLANDKLCNYRGWIPCDANGDIYTYTIASGASTLDVWLKIFGWLL